MMTRSPITSSRTTLGQEPSLWESIWGPTKEVLKTGADIFGQIYPAIKGTAYPSPYPQTPTVYRPGVPGYPQAGYSQAGIAPTTNWTLPIVAGLGGILLITMMGKRR